MRCTVVDDCELVPRGPELEGFPGVLANARHTAPQQPELEVFPVCWPLPGTQCLSSRSWRSSRCAGPCQSHYATGGAPYACASNGRSRRAYPCPGPRQAHVAQVNVPWAYTLALRAGGCPSALARASRTTASVMTAGLIFDCGSRQAAPRAAGCVGVGARAGGSGPGVLRGALVECLRVRVRSPSG